ncbi:putative transcription factor C2H2 family [Helianthus debilis subsp. tardiflorus]
MAVSHSPNSKSKKKAAADTNPQPHKRNSNPGIHGRIYDSHNGSTCHQCRHKTYAAYVSCKNQAKTKPCLIKYCCTCLLNRYGEKVEDVSLLDKWDCPKCKGVCNCSICMKKRGQQPTGIATRMAKASGFSSVSDLIVAKGAQNVSNYKKAKDTTASPKKPGKENLFDGKTRLNTNPLVSVSSTVNEKPKKTKRKGSEVNDVSVTETNHTPNKKQKKLKSKGSKASVRGDVITNLLSKVNGGQQQEKVVKECFEDNQRLKAENKALNLFEVVIPLVTGNELVNIAGVDLPKEDAGNALQLLEFTATFGNILDVKKGQAEAVLRDLIKGRSTRRGKFTSVSQFHIQLLSVIQEKSESESESESESLDMTQGNDSWLKDLKTCISKSKLKDVDFIDMLAGGYDDLDSSTKLRLLVFLCDEVLGTEKIRNWIDEQNAMFSEKRKEAKDKLSVAKDKEKSLKQKMQGDIAKAIIAKEGVPLTIKEHDAIVSKIKDEAAEAHAEMLASEKLVPLDKERPDAVRTEPVFRDNKGHVYWRLKGCSEKPGILQDIGTGDHSVEAVDKWFEYDDEQMDLIEKHINVMRSRFRKYCKN